MSLKYFFASFCTFIVPYLEFEQEILLNREKPVGGEGLYYWTQKTLIIQIQRGRNGHRQAVCFNIYPENRNKEKKAYYLAISDRPNFPSPFRSNILSYKEEAEYRQKGTEENDSQIFLNTTAVRKSKIVPNKFHWLRNKTEVTFLKNKTSPVM